MIVKKIISSGHTGAERAALDVAIKLDIPYGGWISKEHSHSDSMIVEKYQLQEMPFAGTLDLAEKNVLESDALLIISKGKLIGRAEVSRKLALISRRHLLHMDLYTTPTLQGVSIISSWLRLNQVEILCVTGAEAMKDPLIYNETIYLLENALRVNFLKNIVDEFLDDPSASIRNVDEMVNRMMSEMSLKQKVSVANLKTREIQTLQYALDLYISSRREASNIRDMEKTGVYAHEKVTVIVESLRNRLQKTHALRTVK
jgi:hypothetical protein